jgi:hypothetical protein
MHPSLPRRRRSAGLRRSSGGPLSRLRLGIALGQANRSGAVASRPGDPRRVAPPLDKASDNLEAFSGPLATGRGQSVTTSNAGHAAKCQRPGPSEADAVLIQAAENSRGESPSPPLVSLPVSTRHASCRAGSIALGEFPET